MKLTITNQALLNRARLTVTPTSTGYQVASTPGTPQGTAKFRVRLLSDGSYGYLGPAGVALPTPWYNRQRFGATEAQVIEVYPPEGGDWTEAARVTP